MQQVITPADKQVENTTKSTIIQFVILAILLLNVSVSFTAFAFLQWYSYLSLGICIVNFMVLGLINMRKPMASYLDLVVGFYLVLLIIFSIINGTDIKNAIYKSIEVGIVIFCLNLWRRPELMVKSFTLVMSAAAYGNLAVMVLFPDWMFAAKDAFDSYILGGNYNQIGSRLIFGLALNTVCMRWGWWWKLNMVVLSIVSIATLAFVGSMTSLSCILLYIVFCMIPSEKLQKLGSIAFFVFYLLFQCFVVFSGEGLHNNSLAVYIIEDVLGKDITFTNRTRLWDAAGSKFAESPIIGYGWVDTEWYTSEMDSFAIGPHNYIYSVLITGGVTLLSLLIIAIGLVFRRISTKFDKHANILLMGLFTLLFMMLMEVYPFFFLFILLYTLYYYPTMKFDDDEKAQQ